MIITDFGYQRIAPTMLKNNNRYGCAQEPPRSTGADTDRVLRVRCTCTGEASSPGRPSARLESACSVPGWV
jgi:hypothetical protein